MQCILFWHRRLALTLLTLIALGGALVAQQQPDPEPQEVGVLMKRSKPGHFQTLEIVNALKQSELGFFSGQQIYYTVPGRRSNVRFKPGEPVELYLKSFLDSSDPRAAFFPIRDPMRFTLFPSQEDGDDRRVMLEDNGFTTTNRKAGSPFNAQLYGQASFVLTPTSPLPPGEYVVQYPLDSEQGSRLFCFGIDSP